MVNIRYCIHDRSELQKCKLCNMTSTCCAAPILRVNLQEGHYVCTECNKKCIARVREKE